MSGIERGLPPKRKSFGQHFLVDPYVIDSIIGLIAPASADHILEIGPGGGVLTRALVDSGADVVAVEIDRALSRRLSATFAEAGNFSIYNEDILEFDFDALKQRSSQWKIVGNLPYNISTPLIMRLLEQAALCTEMTFMLQHEVATRLTAGCGTRAYGRLSVMAQRKAAIRYRLAVEAACFDPPPKVESAVVQLVPYVRSFDPLIEQRLAELVRTAFSQRRKTIANALRRELSKELFEACGIDPGSRAEVLSGEDFETLTRASLEGV